MGSNDLTDASVSWRSDKGKGVTERLKGLFGPRKKAQDMTTLDDVRFSEPSHLPETDSTVDERTVHKIETDKFEPYRPHMCLEDFVDLQEEDEIVEIMETEPEESVFVHIEAESVIEVQEITTETDEEIDYCDFLPPMCRGERRPVGSRSERVFKAEPASDHMVYDSDEPVSGMRIEPADAADPEVRQETVENMVAEMHYVPNFVLVDEYRETDVIILPAAKTDYDVTLEEMLPDDALKAFDQDDSDVPFDLDIRIYDEEEFVVPVQEMTADREVNEMRSGIGFDFFSPTAARNSGVRFTWGVAEEKEAAPEIVEELPISSSSRFDGMFI